MVEKNIKSKEGFTIIEVVLVLAIAGLIFLMVFVAFPALQRSQKDTRRQSDIERLSSQITNFKTNNSGKIPTGTESTVGEGENVQGTGMIGVLGHYEKSANTWGQNPGTWGYFYDNYLLAGGDVFEDPDGNPYGLMIVTCANGANFATPFGGLTAGTACTNAKAQRTSVEFSTQSNPGNDTNMKIIDSYGGTGSSGDGHSIAIVLGARCDGETSVASSGARDVALVYKKEGGGTLCIAN